MAHILFLLDCTALVFSSGTVYLLIVLLLCGAPADPETCLHCSPARKGLLIMNISQLVHQKVLVPLEQFPNFEIMEELMT